MISKRSGSDVSRRAFLGLVGGGATAALTACRSSLHAPHGFDVPDTSQVGIFDAVDYGVDFSVLVFDALRELRVPVAGRSVVLKPNLVEYAAGAPINTHPDLVIGAAIALRRAGASAVTVAEGPAHRRDTEYLLRVTGLGPALREERVAFVDLNYDDVASVKLRSRFTGLSELSLPTTILRADLVVSMPKLKTHHFAGMTASMKNLFGVVPGAVYGWPKNLLHFRGIQESTVDLTATVRPGLAIVDAVTCMEGDGPIMGTAKHLGCVLVGRDPVAVDATCARLMGLDPSRILYLRAASAFLGNARLSRIAQRGEAVHRFAAEFSVLPAFESMRLSARHSGLRTFLRLFE